MSEIEVKFRHTANFFEKAVEDDKEKSPPGHPSPLLRISASWKVTKWATLYLSLIRAVLCSAALRIGTKAGHWVSRYRKSRKRKKPTQMQPPLEGAACMGLWNTGIDYG